MDYNDVPIFIRVVETGSFTKAAQSFALQKSSVSRSIGRLEDELGVRLLQRNTRNLALTDAGQAFYERVRGAMSGMEEASAAVRELGSKPRGTIRMTAPIGADSFGLAEAITEFLGAHPGISIDLLSTGRMVDLVSEGFDLALRAGKLIDSSLIARKVGTDDFALWAAPEYLKRKGRPKSLRDLAKHECILFRGRSGKANWTLVGETGEQTVEVTGALNSDELSFVLRACIAGAGIATLPPVLVRQALSHGELEVVLGTYHMPGPPLHIVLPSSTFVPTRVALLRDHLVQHLERTAEQSRVACSSERAKLRTRAQVQVPRQDPPRTIRARQLTGRT